MLPARLDTFLIRLRRLSTSRWFWLGFPILLYSWTLTGPFIVDDIHLLLKAESYRDGRSPALDLYRFARTDAEWNNLRNRGVCPWWVESGRLDFVRPIGAWSFYFDTVLFGRNVLAFRLMSLAVFAGALLAVHWMFRATGADTARAGAATFFMGISQTATPPVTWMCSRADLFVLIGAAMTAGAYWSIRKRPGLRWFVLGALAFTLALFSKEFAVALCPVIVLHELITWRKSATRASRSFAAMILLLSIAYLAYYIQSRPWIASGADHMPSQLAGLWPRSILLYLSVWTLGFPIDILLAANSIQVWTVALIGGGIALLVIRYLRRSARNDAATLFFAIWAIAFILPPLRAMSASTRSLCVATVGWTYLLTSLILPPTEKDVVVPRLFRHFLFTANGMASIGCVIATVLYMNITERRAQDRLLQVCRTIPGGVHDGDLLVITQAESTADLMCSGDRLEFLTGVRNVSTTHLLPAGIEASAEVEDSHTVLVRAKNHSLFDSALHHLTLPSGWQPELGQEFRLKDCTVKIAQISDKGGVDAIRVLFAEPLNSTRVHFIPPADAESPDSRARLVHAKSL
ncbi:MAG TPA: hypothetical protein VMV81_11840 [Phycisphaerae bacterium]|nr:hypothetical protein [Phycisphaerae bacterium]